MAADLTNHFVIAVSSRAVFDLEKENAIFDTQGLDAYQKYQRENEKQLLAPGPAFRLIRNLLNLNTLQIPEARIEVVIVSRNNADISLRITRSLEHYGLDITRSVWSSGAPITPYLRAFNAGLFLSAHPSDVQDAINSGFAAARIWLPSFEVSGTGDKGIRIAFDGDAVLFSDEAERIYQDRGLQAFVEHEKNNAQKPLPEGPFAGVLRTLSRIQDSCGAQLIRTALITARNSPAHERIILTLRAWSVHIDEVFFLGGLEKKSVIEAFKPDFYFDDQDKWCASSSGIAPTGQVPWKTQQ
jgi:5'-nucleotidase